MFLAANGCLTAFQVDRFARPDVLVADPLCDALLLVRTPLVDCGDALSCRCRNGLSKETLMGFLLGGGGWFLMPCAGPRSHPSRHTV